MNGEGGPQNSVVCHIILLSSPGTGWVGGREGGREGGLELDLKLYFADLGLPFWEDLRRKGFFEFDLRLLSLLSLPKIDEANTKI